MEDKSIAYFRTEIGDYALTPKMRGDFGVEPKNMLVRLSPKKSEEHRKEMIEAEALCTTLRTGARFCIFKSEHPRVEIEAIEMCLPSWKYSVMLKEHEVPSIERSRREYKNAFLVLSIKPPNFGEKLEHIQIY